MFKHINLALAGFIILGLVVAGGAGIAGSTVLAASALPAYSWGLGYGQEPWKIQLPDGVSGFTDVAAGGTFRVPVSGGGGPHALGMGSDGKLYAWGYNGLGQLGDGTTTSSRMTQVKLPASAEASGLKEFDAGGLHSLALTNDGKIYVWGDTRSGQLGNGTQNTADYLPTLVTFPAGVTAFTAIAAGHEHNLALGNDGKVYAWGNGVSGQIGNGTNNYSTLVPTPVALPVGVTAIAAGHSHSLALGNDGKIYTWGANWGGQLGNGTNTPSNVPVAVTFPAGVSRFTDVVAGEGHSFGLGNDGRYYAWGENNLGELGVGTRFASSNLPLAVALPAGVTSFTEISGGADHSLGLGDDGKLYAWGNNGWGQLGNGTPAYNFSTVPTPVSIPAGVTKFAAGNDYSVALLGTFVPNSNKKNKEVRPANLVAKLRVNPDREFSTSKPGEVLAYTLSLKNSGPGKAGQVYLTFPIAEGLEAGYTEFNRSDIWVEKVVLEGVDQPYMQIRYPALESQVETEIKLYFRVKAGATPAEGSSFLSRFTVNWSDEAKPVNQRSSNAVRVSFTGREESRNSSGGEVQAFQAPQGAQLTIGSATKLGIVGDFYAPGELVTFWYTDKDSKSTELVSSKADEAGKITLELQAASFKAAGEYVVAGYGNLSGIYGNVVVQVADK